MPMILLGLGYLLLAAAGPPAGASPWPARAAARRRPHTGPRACSSRADSRPWSRGRRWCGSSPCRIRGSRRRRRSWGCRSARSRRSSRRFVWWMPRHGGPVSDGVTESRPVRSPRPPPRQPRRSSSPSPSGRPRGSRRGRRARGRRRDGGGDGARPYQGLWGIPATRRRCGSGIRRRDRRRLRRRVRDHVGRGGAAGRRVRPGELRTTTSSGSTAASGSEGRAVTELTTAPNAVTRPGEIVDVALRAQQQELDLPSGRSIDAWTFGALAGPAIVARVGDTLSVAPGQCRPRRGATVHWHGYPVANASTASPG